MKIKPNHLLILLSIFLIGVALELLLIVYCCVTKKKKNGKKVVAGIPIPHQIIKKKKRADSSWKYKSEGIIKNNLKIKLQNMQQNIIEEGDEDNNVEELFVKMKPKNIIKDNDYKSEGLYVQMASIIDDNNINTSKNVSKDTTKDIGDV